MTDLKTCPFCGDSDLTVAKVVGGVHDQYYAHCRRCGCNGPLAPGEEEALYIWNRRVNEPV